MGNLTLKTKSKNKRELEEIRAIPLFPKNGKESPQENGQ